MGFAKPYWLNMGLVTTLRYMENPPQNAAQVAELVRETVGATPGSGVDGVADPGLEDQEDLEEDDDVSEDDGDAPLDGVVSEDALAHSGTLPSSEAGGAAEAGLPLSPSRITSAPAGSSLTAQQQQGSAPKTTAAVRDASALAEMMLLDQGLLSQPESHAVQFTPSDGAVSPAGAGVSDPGAEFYSVRSSTSPARPAVTTTTAASVAGNKVMYSA